MIIKTLLITAIFFCLTTTAFAHEPQTDGPVIPHRIIDMGTMQVIDFEGLIHRMQQADIVAVGEQHDDPASHLIEFAMLEGLGRYKGSDVILSMEFIERDGQPVLDKYLAGEISEEDFLAHGQVSSNYQTDYRPMVEFSKHIGAPVIAANLPHKLSSSIAMKGYDSALEGFTWQERRWFARGYDAADDAYKTLFFETLKGFGEHGGGMAMDDALLERFYQAQVAKDEAMSESVVKASEEHPGSTVFHLTGGFHIMNRLGTYARILRRFPEGDTLCIQIQPVDNLLDPVIQEDLHDCDYMILVLAQPEEEKIEETVPPGETESESNEE